MSSYGKQKDRVSAYAKSGTMTNWAHQNVSENHHGPNSDAGLKKKHYRARGCRGGATRKGKKKVQYHQPQDDREAQENMDPLPNKLQLAEFVDKNIIHVKLPDSMKQVLAQQQSQNNISDKHSYNITDNTSKEGPKRHKFIHNSKKYGSDAFAAWTGRKSIPPVDTPAKAPSMSILPKESDEDDGNIELLVGFHEDKDVTLTTDTSKFKRAHSPVAASTAGSTAPSPGGFSFFSISPRSYLTGKKSKTQKIS
jgi:hypothetical protein